MEARESTGRRLSDVTTLWSVVRRAHDADAQAARSAQTEVLNRYAGAVRRYLLAAVRDQDAADELFQEFAYGFLCGRLRGADRDRGRFRDFLKGVLFHLIADHHNRLKKQPQALDAHCPEPAIDHETLSHLDQTFRTSWRESLLARAWCRLEAAERQQQQPWFTVLRFRAEHPDTPSPRMAEHLSQLLKRPFTAAAVRQTLHRARERFAELLVEEVAGSLANPTAEQIEQELDELGLLEHCGAALERRGRGQEAEDRRHVD